MLCAIFVIFKFGSCCWVSAILELEEALEHMFLGFWKLTDIPNIT